MHAQSADQREQMRSAIAALPEPMQTAYRLHLFDGLDYEAIAAALDTSVREVERLIARSIVLIDQALRAPRT